MITLSTGPCRHGRLRGGGGGRVHRLRARPEAAGRRAGGPPQEEAHRRGGADRSASISGLKVFLSLLSPALLKWICPYGLTLSVEPNGKDI